jgi:hypothetical protein
VTPRLPASTALVVVLAAALAACSPAPSVEPSATEAAAPPLVVGCLGIRPDECQFVVDVLLPQLPRERGAPFAVEIWLSVCENLDPCPQSLAFRDGSLTVEYANGAEPISYFVDGPPATLELGVARQGWLGPFHATSPRVNGAGPFPFDVGHCGLLWQVDFDGSFWLPIGQVDGDASELINADSGRIALLGPNLAEYRNARGFVTRLARMPGAKFVFGCD